MKKLFVVKSFRENVYYCGENFGWREESWMAEFFTFKAHAKAFIRTMTEGKYLIETIYEVE